MPVTLVPGRTISTHDGLSGTHAAVVDDTGPTIPEISARLFFSEVLPQPPVLDHIPAIFGTLTGSTQPDYNYTKRRWLAFPQNPAKVKLKEETMFRRLEKVYHAVLQAASTHCPTEKPVTLFTNSQEYIPKGDWRKSTSKPDAFFALRDRRAGGSPHWMDIAATGEFKRDKLNNRNRDDDSKKILWNMHQTMRRDPCRRFTFGFTIDNREMRIWYASRADILVSTRFDFMEIPLLLIEFFLVFSYADIHTLGWDSTLRCEWRGPDKLPHYIMTVRSEETGEEVDFRAMDVLSDRGAEVLRGRGTRVFKVRRLEGGEEVGDELVLKDCWVDADRASEGKIMADIKRDAAGTPQEAVLESGLLTVIMHGDVRNGGEIDRTISKDKRKGLFVDDSVFLIHRSDAKVEGFKGFTTKRGLDERAAEGSHPSRIDYDSLNPRMYCPKKHYRVVFKEICKPLFLEDRLCGILLILSQTCSVLKALHEIGWVHRDISSGNILTDGDTVKLSDLEFAKKIGETTNGVHEVRTGTPDFMSIEVHKMGYKFRAAVWKLPPIVAGDSNGTQDAWDTVMPAISMLIQDYQYVVTPWFYNPLHDLESVFWLLAYYVLSRDIYLPDARNWPPPFEQESHTARSTRIQAQYELMECLFVRRRPEVRATLLTCFGDLEGQLRKIPLQPALLKIYQYLVRARDALHFQFIESEKTPPIPLDKAPTIAGPLYAQFECIIHNMRRYLLENHISDVQCRPLSTVYATMEAVKAEGVEERKKIRYQLAEKLYREQENERMHLARSSEIVTESVALGAPSTPNILVTKDMRRSQRIASRIVQSTLVDEGDSGETEGTKTSEHERRRITGHKSTRKLSTGTAPGKRKRRDDEHDADNRPSPRASSRRGQNSLRTYL